MLPFAVFLSFEKKFCVRSEFTRERIFDILSSGTTEPVTLATVAAALDDAFHEGD